MRHVLSECEDFVNEVSSLDAILRARPRSSAHHVAEGPLRAGGVGHRVRLGQDEDVVPPPQSIGSSAASSMRSSSAPCPRRPSHSPPGSGTSRKFARKARAYRRAYREGVDNALTSIESMVKTFKTHRNAMDFAFKFITDT